MDPYVGHIRAMPRLTEQHVNPAHIKKMKVSCCTQVFSNSVAKAINLMAYSGSLIYLLHLFVLQRLFLQEQKL